ncbi:MAG: cupin domain-containing protein [Gammaproteobacteria bacterium]|nr:cupin domain-containing protein [Gammaproteobacteria bacterium]
MNKSILVFFALVCFIGVANAETPAGGTPKGQGLLGQKQLRTILSKTDLAVAPGMETVVLTVDGAPGLVGKKHFHPGDEFIYIAEGTLTLDVAGKGKVTLNKGETLHIPAKVAHQAVNPSSNTPFKAVTFGIFEKGQPDTTLVDQ